MICRRYLSSVCLLWNFAVFAAPVSLEEAYRAALGRSEMVQLSHEKVEQADANLTKLRGGIFPNVSFNFQHVIQPEPADPVARQFSPGQQTTALLSVKQPVFRGLREWYGLSQLNHIRSAHQSMEEWAAQQLYREVASAYLSVLTLEQDLKNLAEQSEIYDSRVKELSARVKRGESNQTDVVTAQSTQSSLQAEMQVTRGQLESTRENFHFLTGLPSDAALTDPNLAASYQLEPLDKYLQKVEERPDVKAAQASYEAASRAVTRAWGAHLPSVDLYGNYYLTRPGFLSNLKWDVGLQLTIPIFEGWATQAGVSEAVSQRKEAELELEKTRRMARQEVRSLYSQLKARLDQVKSLKRSAELSKTSTELLQRDYRRGLARNIDVQLALTESRMTQRGFDKAHFDSQLNVIQLRSASGMIAPAKGPSNP